MNKQENMVDLVLNGLLSQDYSSSLIQIEGQIIAPYKNIFINNDNIIVSINIPN